MQIRTAILVAGTTAAMIAPNAFAHIPSDELNGGGPAVAAHAQTFNGAIKHRSSFRSSSLLGPFTENSYGQHKSSRTGKIDAGLSTGVKVIVVPTLPSSGAAQVAPDPSACVNSGSNCTDEQLCDIWGENCDVWAAEQAAEARAANEQLPSSN
jgi:hypothetical protein